MKESFFGGVHALRAVAALLVVFAHASSFAAQFNGVEESWVRSFGRIGVVLFFSISGFVIAHTRHQPTGEFFKRRFLRIYPIYWVAILLAMLLKSGVYLTLPSVLLLPWNSTNDSLLIPYWTLSFEVLFYVIAGCVFYVQSKGRLTDRHVVVLAFAWIALINIVNFEPRDLSESTYPGSMFLLSPIIQVLPMGYILRIWYRKPTKPIRGCLLIAAGLFYWFSTFYVEHFIGETARRHLFLGIATTLLVAALADFPLRSRILKFLGDASYSIYLIHIPIMLAAISVVTSLPTLSYFLLGATGGIALGFVDRFLVRHLIGHSLSQAS